MTHFFNILAIITNLPLFNRFSVLILQDISNKITPPDIASKDFYQKLLNKKIQLIILAPADSSTKIKAQEQYFEIEILANHIKIKDQLSAHADLTLITDFDTLEKLYEKQLNITDAIQTQKLTIKGNQDLISDLFSLFSEYNIDLEFILSKYVGDIGAHYINKGLATGLDLANNAKNLIMQQFSQQFSEPSSKHPNGFTVADDTSDKVNLIKELEDKVKKLEAELKKYK